MEAQSLTTCNQCGKKFQRKAHLLRHQQQHSGDRPYSCKFCSKTFKRSDVLRDHFSRCERRGSSAIPNSLERGRKRHACDECSRLKVKCDNEVPCRKCKEFGRVCVKSRSAPTNPGEASPSSSGPEFLPNSDRNSIGFLLNCPEETAFMREFPKSTTLSPSTNGDDVAAPMPDYTQSHPPTTSAPPAGVYHDYNRMGELDVILSNLEFSKFEEDNHNIQVPGENIMIWQEPQIPYVQSTALEQRALDIKEKLRLVAGVQSSPDLPPKEVMDAIEIITANSITSWIALYFRHWHKHAPIVHEVTFHSSNAALPLVLALMCLGGMYSKEPEEVSKLKLLLDTIEGYIFSLPRFTINLDISERTYPVESTSSEWRKYQLEELQGAYLMVIVQFWTGNPGAKRRMRQHRVVTILAIFRDLGYQTMQHSLALVVKDEESFGKWVHTECIVRTVSWAAMLDNALAIFHNIKPRLQWSEIDLSFSGDNHYFNAASYNDVAMLNRPPEPVRKIKDFYLVLFSPIDRADEDLNVLRAGKVTAMDMQMMIHFLYNHFWASTFGNPLTSLPATNIQLLLQPFYTATRNWKLIWGEIKSSANEDEWNKLGFQRTAEMYYEAVVVLLGIFERNAGRFPPIPGDCDKWNHFKLLLKFDPGSMLAGMGG